MSAKHQLWIDENLNTEYVLALPFKTLSKRALLAPFLWVFIGWLRNWSLANFHMLGISPKYKVFDYRRCLRYGKKTQKRIVASAKHQVLWGRTQEIWNWREYWTLWRTFKQIGSVWKTSGFVKIQKIQKCWIFNIVKQIGDVCPTQFLWSQGQPRGFCYKKDCLDQPQIVDNNQI